MARQRLNGFAGKSPNLSRSVRLEVEFLEDRVTPAALNMYETSALQIINQLRADPTSFANDIKNLYLGGTYQSPSGYAANDPIWTDLRADINSAETTTSWRSGFNSTGPNTFWSMASALPARAPLVWDAGMQDGAIAHNQWMYTNVYAHSVFTQGQAPTISESQASPIPGITRNFNVNPGDWFNYTGLNAAGENISYAYNSGGAAYQAYRNGQISIDGYYQRLVYADVIGFMMEFSSGGSWGHLQNLGGNYNVLGIATRLYENPVESHQDGVAESYFSTHRIGLRASVSYMNFLVYQDLNNNNAYDAGEGRLGQLTYNFGATSHTLPETGYGAVQLPASGMYTVSASYLGNSLGSQQFTANGANKTMVFKVGGTPADITGPRVTASSILGTSTSVNGIRLTFSEPINAATFTTADATLTGPAGSLTISGIVPVNGSIDTQFDVTFATQTAAGAYQLVVGPDIRDSAGNAMDQNQNSANGETSADRYTTSFTINAPPDTTGARVTASSILGTSTSVNGVRLTFSEPINAATFTTADATLTGPAGSLTINGVGPVAGSNNTQFDITFAAQTAAGAYQVVVGPDIRDTAGNALNQNQNGANGEASADQYSAPFTINGAAATTYLYIDFGPSGFWRWSAATGYQQLHGADVDGFSVGNDGFVTIDFGSNGLWRWSQSTGYQQLHSANVENVVAGANGFVYVDFGNSGFWRWSQATGYQQLHTANVEGFSAGNNGFVYIDFGGSGLWRWSQATGYQQLHTANVETVAAGPDGFAYIDFGNSGFWRWSQATGYQQLHTANVEGFSVGYDGFVAIDFGVNGLWRWSQTTGYQQLHTANVENTAAGQDGFLFIDFGAAGLWRWSAVTGYLMLNSINPQQIGA